MAASASRQRRAHPHAKPRPSRARRRRPLRPLLRRAGLRAVGSSGPFDGFKRDVYEGGMRVPTFVWRKGGFTKTWRRYDIVKDPHQDNDLAAAPQP